MSYIGSSTGRQTRREYIFSQWDCLSFATDVLHLHVDARGRAKSLDGQSSRGNEALSITHDVWYDFKKQVGGTVIDLCAWSMFNGDIGQAMNYLAGDFYDIDATEWQKAVTEMTRQCEQWHKKLLPDDREYLHSRNINDETIKRLRLGSMTYDANGHISKRISIPYFKNGRIVYYISRDRTGFEGAPKYQKCALIRDSKKNDKEVLQNIPWGLHTLSRRTKAYQSTFNDYAIDKREWLIIAEGIFDAMSFEQEGYCVLGTGGGHFSPTVESEVLGYAKEFKHVLVIFDNDGAGTDFQRKMSKKLFGARCDFNVGYVPSQFNGKEIKDVSDYYCAGGNLADLIAESKSGLDFLSETIEDKTELKEFFYQTARYAEKSDVIQLYQGIERRKVFNHLWLKTVLEEATHAPAETVIVRELTERYNLKHVEGSGFFEYLHGVWKPISDNKVKSYADKALGRYASNGRMTNIMNFMKARTHSDDPMNTQSIINLRNGVLVCDKEKGFEFVPHSPTYQSSIQLTFNYDPEASCPLWLQFIDDITDGNEAKSNLLQEIAGYPFWPDNGLEKCFFLIGDGGNGKGVYMDTLRDVYGRDNCSALALSSFGSQFDAIMLQYSLVNFASENKVDLRGNIERLKEVTSGNEIVAAHKGVDAVKFAPRCKLITSCNDFFNTGDITHALMRRMCFVQFTNNYVQEKRADVNLKEKLREELPGILNWCIEGYLRLMRNARNPECKDKFTPTQEDIDLKREFMRTTNPVAFFIEERLMCVYGVEYDTHTLYHTFKTWSDESGYKTLSLGAFTNRIKRVMRELRPEVRSEYRRNHTWLIFPEAK